MVQNNDAMRELALAKAMEMQAIAQTTNQLQEAGAIARRRPIKRLVGLLASLALSVTSLTKRVKPASRPAEAREARRA